jgi:hypothetical protein
MMSMALPEQRLGKTAAVFVCLSWQGEVMLQLSSTPAST